MFLTWFAHRNRFHIYNFHINLIFLNTKIYFDVSRKLWLRMMEPSSCGILCFWRCGYDTYMMKRNLEVQQELFIQQRSQPMNLRVFLPPKPPTVVISEHLMHLSDRLWETLQKIYCKCQHFFQAYLTWQDISGHTFLGKWACSVKTESIFFILGKAVI